MKHSLQTRLRISRSMTKHGHKKIGQQTRTYISWRSMKLRCRVQKKGYEGITVCERWKTFAYFLEDMGERPEGKTLDRIDPNGNYEPSNCRWSTHKEQANNRRPKNITKSK